MPTKCCSCLGRVLLSLILVMSAIHKISAWNETAEQMTRVGIPAVPLMLMGAIVFELGGGLSVMFGVKARLGAVLLILFLIPTTAIFHDFWSHEGSERQMQMIQFMKNLAILGGLLLVASFGPGVCCVLGGRRTDPDKPLAEGAAT